MPVIVSLECELAVVPCYNSSLLMIPVHVSPESEWL